MSYCVHCGVELDEQAKRCPLCGTPVVDPSALEPVQEAPFFASRREEVPPVLALLRCFSSGGSPHIPMYSVYDD